MTLGYTSYVVIPLFTWPVSQSPRFHRGYPATIAFVAALWSLTLLAMWSQRKHAPRLDEVGEEEKAELERTVSSSREGSVKSEIAFRSEMTDVSRSRELATPVLRLANSVAV